MTYLRAASTSTANACVRRERPAGSQRRIKADAVSMAPDKFSGLPLMSDHDLIGAYCYAAGLTGHGPEPWVARAVIHWQIAAKAELRRRGLLKDAKRVKKAMWEDHHKRHPRETA
jgi:hypothetical protein